jgi:hypothetical protein
MNARVQVQQSPWNVMKAAVQMELREGHRDRRRISEMLGIAAERGQFIVSTSDYINEHTPIENVHAIRAAVDRP